MRIEKRFKKLKAQKKKAFIAFITAGDFGLSTTKRLISLLDKCGVDIIELGVPFSDPIADGTTIQAASERALKRGTTLSGIIKTVSSLRPLTDVPIVLMTYFNPIFKYGLKKFVSDCEKNEIDGVIVPDLPPEEADELITVSKGKGFSTIFLLSPTSTKERIKLVAKKSKGFIYYVSLTGITGARERLPKELISQVRLVKRYTKKPVCVGFGVSRPSQVKEICKVADGVIVGSAIVKVIERYAGKKNLLEAVGRYVKGLARATHR
ncbi:MAG: tryptophan synthase subunit alpha [Candidatus Omnitrophota bacterium]